jgi:PAS domain S-box-containing protein
MRDVAVSGERPEAESLKAVEESREWLRVTLGSIGDGVITTDEHGRVAMLNPVAQALTGWTQADAVDRDLREVFHIVNQDTGAEVENPALRALRDGLIVGLANHTLLIARDGTERPIDDSAAPIRNAQGEVAGAVLVFRDITERHAQERRVRDSLEYAVNIMETLRGPFLVLETGLRVISGNRAFYETFGTERSQTEGRRIFDLGNGQWDIPKLRELLEDVLPQNHAFDGFEVEHDFEVIGRKTMLLNARRIRRPNEHSDLILLAIEDISERRAAEQELRDSEIRYRRLFQTAKDGILILDANSGKIVDANAFMSSLVGLDPADLIGKELYEIGMFRDVEENKEAFRELQRTRYLRHEHLPVRNQRGEQVEVEFIANVYQEDRRLVAQCNVRDISERVAMQKKIAEQATAIANESRAKDEFLAMLSHELRNPLAPIRSAVYVLKLEQRNGGENPIQKEAREIIERQSANLTKLISDLMEVSRVVSGRIRLTRQSIDLNEVVRHAIETVAPLVRKHDHTLALNLCDEPVWVLADATRMEEVVINLLNNAVKYTPDGGRIAVWCEQPRGANYAQVRVRDTGIGIAKNLLPRIFDLFTQAERSLARSEGGLGIGLSLAHRIVQLHGGTIEATSPPEGVAVGVGGSEFIVRLSAMGTPQDAPVSTDVPEIAEQSEGVKVLVIDDNIDLVSMLGSTLRRKGYGVRSANTGPDGLTAASEWGPDVVLLDIGLPGLDGYEVARRLRSNPEFEQRKVKLIAISGYGRDTDKALAREAGFDAHLLKPLDFDELERTLTQLLRDDIA